MTSDNYGIAGKKIKITKTRFAAVILLSVILISIAYATSSQTIIVSNSGKIGYSLSSYLQTFHSGRGILGVLDGSYNRDNIFFARMQLSAEINNSATIPADILVPSGGYYDRMGHMTITSNAWSEGGINFDNLKRNLAYCWDNGYFPILALWTTNIDPMGERTYVTSNMVTDIPAQPMANLTGYIKFFTWLKEWMNQSGYANKQLIWEPCWEFNLYPWTDWGGAGVGRNWALHPSSYENAMKTIKEAKAATGFNNIIIAGHIVSWSSDEWFNRGKLRINGTAYPDDIGYLNGLKQCDVWGISLYGEWDLSSSTNDVVGKGVTGYVDWLFEKIIKQCASDPDIGSTFIGTFEYNMPVELYDLTTTLNGYTTSQRDQMAVEYINYTYSKIPQYFANIKFLGWWIPFGSTAQLNTWKDWSEYYDSWKP